MTRLSLPFVLRGRTGEVQISVVANDDPARLGCDLLDPSLDRLAAWGYPVCEATPDIAVDGYAGMCGWIQLVRSSDASGEFELDPLALFRNVDTPFAFFGVKPVLFDAPFRESRRDLVWEARSFLCAVPDAVMSRVIEPVAAFEWGFQVADGQISIAGPSSLHLAAWDEHADLLRKTFPGWTFRA
jgi:hypothetical protein